MLVMSFYHTTTAMRSKQKTHTLRPGWKNLKAGDRVEAVVKYRGVALSDRQTLGVIAITDVTRKPLNTITEEIIAREGFPGWTVPQFVQWYCMKMKVQPTYVLAFISFTHET